jgi:hypothetical protein
MFSNFSGGKLENVPSITSFLELELNRSLSYGYRESPLDPLDAPFNPTSCRTTNNFNVLMPFGTAAAGNSLYFGKAQSCAEP